MKKLAIAVAICCCCNVLAAQTSQKHDNKKIYNSADTVRMEKKEKEQPAVSNDKGNKASTTEKRVPWPPEGEVWKDSSGKDSNMIGAMPR